MDNPCKNASHSQPAYESVDNGAYIRQDFLIWLPTTLQRGKCGHYGDLSQLRVRIGPELHRTDLVGNATRRGIYKVYHHYNAQENQAIMQCTYHQCSHPGNLLIPDSNIYFALAMFPSLASTVPAAAHNAA